MNPQATLHNEPSTIKDGNPITISVAEAMRISGIAQTHFYSLMADGVIASRKCGKRRLVLFQSLSDYLHNLPTGKLTPQN